MTAYKENNDSFRLFLAQTALKLGSLAGAWRVTLPAIEKIAHKATLSNNKDERVNGSWKQREDKFYMVFNVVRAAFKAYENGAPAVKNTILNLFLKEFLNPSNHQKKEIFKNRYGVNPPGFMTISPEGTCNLHCRDCYAASIPKDLPRLSAETFTRILNDKREQWSSWFTVISGGEPFIWNDHGTDLIDIATQNQNQFFMVYTNGTRIDKTTARRMAEAGNISPAISVEGFEQETDYRRGKGTYAKILQAFDNLNEAGVPYGISVTANAFNVDKLFTDEMVEFYFKKNRALYQWVFQYMPIGRGADVNIQIPPDVRKRIWYREQDLIRKERLLIADFWNGGLYSSGCIAGGREDGYLYIDWNGNIYPCVFIPYWKDNIHKIYAEGRSLSDALFSDLFTGIRQWQKDYSFRKPVSEKGNEIRPCFFRDHHDIAHTHLCQCNAHPGNDSAKLCLNDREYLEAMKKYDQDFANLVDPIWNEQYKDPDPPK
ncbi:MAG: radical SAM protein [Fibrobacter sp.]|nr:radical SAM protein [Fibrobacter sp.]